MDFERTLGVGIIYKFPQALSIGMIIAKIAETCSANSVAQTPFDLDLLNYKWIL